MSTVTRIANAQMAVEIADLGAEMQSLTSADGRSWLWNGDPAFWTGRAPVLFPIVGKAPDNKISIDGEQYEMAQHGFARRTSFQLDAASDTACRYVLMASDATRALYPFEFKLAAEYKLDGTTVSVEAEVQNLDKRPIPFGFGFHPAFRWPLPGAEGGVHHVALDNGAEPSLARLSEGLLTGEMHPSPFRQGRLVLDHSLFDADALIFPEGAGEGLAYEADDGPRLRFKFHNLPNIALWSKPGRAPFLCVEPWHGMAAQEGKGDALAARPYTNVLAAGDTVGFGYSVTVDL